MDSVYELFIDQMKDIYSAEQQLTKALPKLVKAAATPALSKAFANHLKETENQIKRLDAIASELSEKFTGKKCKAMEGLIEEGAEVIEEDGEPTIKDIGLVVAGQRVEHYEIAAYGNAVMLAEHLGLKKAAKLLKQSLDEESAADETLTAVTQKNILPNVPSEEGEEEEERETSSGKNSGKTANL